MKVKKKKKKTTQNAIPKQTVKNTYVHEMRLVYLNLFFKKICTKERHSL